MWQLIKALFLGGTTLITPNPIEIGDKWITLTPKETLTAINSGATLDIDVTTVLPSSINAVDRLSQGQILFPTGCAQAQLITGGGKTVSLRTTGVAASNTQTFLLLSADAGLTTDMDFSTIRLRADCGVKSTFVYSSNFSK